MISHILKVMIFQFRVDMFLRPNNEKTTSDFIMCVCVYLKYIHLQNKSKTNDFLCQISRLFVLLKAQQFGKDVREDVFTVCMYIVYFIFEELDRKSVQNCLMANLCVQ